MTYTLHTAWQHRPALHAYLKNPELSAKTVLKITPQLLNQKGIEVLVLDFDGVMAPHNGSIPLPAVIAWLKKLQHEWHKPIYIFSNKPLPERAAFFKAEFPHIGFIRNVAKKPYPEGLEQLIAQTGVKPAQILMVDDRLLTGILCAILGGTQGLLITRPYQDFSLHPVKEAFFHVLRWLDRRLV